MSLLCSLSAPPGSKRSACQSANQSTGAKLVQLLVLQVRQVHRAILVPQQPPAQVILVLQLQALQVTPVHRLQVHQAILVPQQPPVQVTLVPRLQALQVILVLHLQALQVILVHLQAQVPLVTLVPALARAPPRLLAVMTMAPPPLPQSHPRWPP